MGFIGVYRALYDYAPQAQGELAIQERDLLYVLEKDGGDGWWKAKKKAGTDDEEEPEGLVPHNYIEEASAICHARALYEYTRQTDEELSFPEDALLEVFDTSDPDWILVGLDGEFGFVPSNYIEMSEPSDNRDEAATPGAPALPARPTSIASEPSGSSDAPGAAVPPAAAALAGVLAGRSMPAPESPVSPPSMPSRSRSTRDERVSDDEPARSPALPTRPRPTPEVAQIRHEANVEDEPSPEVRRAPGGFHMYNINEMVSVMGKRKKMPTTLGINLGTGVILIAPERASDGPSQEWTAEKMTHYSREGKHVFMELVRPSKSVDFHAGAKDTAEEIVAALGEMAGAVRAEGLKEVIMAGTQSGRKKGQVLYDFMAQGEDEVTVAIGDEVIIIDDAKSEEWWQVRRLKNGKEGVVPSSYIEVTGVTSPISVPGPNHGDSVRSTVEQNRLEEVRLTKEALRASKEPQEVGPGMTLPERGSSLSAREHGNDSSQQRSRRENGQREGSSKVKSKPDSSKVRTWTDRSRSFSVEAQFLGLKDGKIHLHKMNGVKIAVPIAKMSREDLEYVENVTGISLDDEKPLADVKKSKPVDRADKTDQPGTSGAVVNKKSEYDWFQFFLDCDVAVGLCERYAQAFIKDSMDESVLPDVDASVLRQLGLREGDIIKVMRHLDGRYGRSKQHAEGEADGGGLFSGPGGALKNNTRKGRPAPAVQTSDVVDPKAFSTKGTVEDAAEGAKSSPPVTSPANDLEAKSTATGFDDDAWDVKPSKQQPPARAVSASPPNPGSTPSVPQPPALTGSLKELSLLTAPLEPTRTGPTTATESNTAQNMEQVQPSAPPQPQPQGATPSFFSSVSPQTTSRQRPLPPQASPLQGGIVPPPARPLSAPQSAQPSAFAPPPQMMPQMTGVLQGRPAPPGQSLNELTQARLQQQYLANMQQQQQPMMTGYIGQQMPAIAPMYTGAPAQFMQPMMTGAVGPSPFADPGRPAQFSPVQTQPTGFQPSFTGAQAAFPQQAPPLGINSYLPPPLEPQRTGMPGIQPQITGMNSFNQQPAVQPLQPQKTGPPPPVRFGVPVDAKKLTPQATGRRANLSQATPQNPFGF